MPTSQIHTTDAPAPDFSGSKSAHRRSGAVVCSEAPLEVHRRHEIDLQKGLTVESTVALRQKRRTENTTKQIAAVLENLVAELIDDQEVCKVTFTHAGNLVLIEIFPDGPRAAGQLIGKQGRTIAALRTLATAICAKYGWRAQLEIVA